MWAAPILSRGPKVPARTTLAPRGNGTPRYSQVPSVTVLWLFKPLTCPSRPPLQGEGRGFESLSAHRLTGLREECKRRAGDIPETARPEEAIATAGRKNPGGASRGADYDDLMRKRLLASVLLVLAACGRTDADTANDGYCREKDRMLATQDRAVDPAGPGGATATDEEQAKIRAAIAAVPSDC